MSHQWPGHEIGVKFDPFDIELLEYLARKYGGGNLKALKNSKIYLKYIFIEEFVALYNCSRNRSIKSKLLDNLFIS